MPKVKDKGQNVPKDHPYGGMNIKELKEQLKKKGAKVSGRKADLVARLESYDRNSNFGNCTQEGPVFEMDLPDASNYRDINTDTKLPEINESGVQAYLELFDQQLQKKTITMYSEKFLRSLRHSSSNQGRETLICGRVSAEMRKHVIYKVDVKIDAHNAICETQCECGAGMGPNAHCKHVALVLYALTKYKDGIITRETCTQVLQTFHQVKKYNGSPVKIENLALRMKQGIDSIPSFEPRQQHLIESPSYEGHFRSVWMNSSGRDLAIRENYIPANLIALYHDHDYFQKTPEDHFLQQLYITDITAEELINIEKVTRTQSKSKQWHTERAKRLQASNFHRICTATDRTDKTKLAESFTNIGDNIVSAPLVHGKTYEDKAIKVYEKETSSSVKPSGIIVHPDIPYLGCSPDGLISDTGIIEVKCPYKSRFDIPDETSVPYLLIDEGGSLYLKKNHQYYYQVMGTLLCTRRQWCDFIVWTYKGFVVVRINRDDSFIGEMTLRLTDFFDNFFKDALLAKHVYKKTSRFNFDQDN